MALVIVVVVMALVIVMIVITLVIIMTLVILITLVIVMIIMILITLVIIMIVMIVMIVITLVILMIIVIMIIVVVVTLVIVMIIMATVTTLAKLNSRHNAHCLINADAVRLGALNDVEEALLEGAPVNDEHVGVAHGVNLLGRSLEVVRVCAYRHDRDDLDGTTSEFGDDVTENVRRNDNRG